MVIFVEHYPWSAAEQQLFKQLNLKEVPVLTAMDVALKQRFGGPKIIHLMQRLGVKDDEVLSHPNDLQIDPKCTRQACIIFF